MGARSHEHGLTELLHLPTVLAKILRMIECLVKNADGALEVSGDVFERAIRPAVPHTVGPGKWTIDVGGDRFVDFSPEPPGLQITFEGTIERELAERVTADVIKNLVSLTGSHSFQVVWLS